MAVVWVDAPSFAGVERVPGPAEAASLRLARAGVPVARLGAGDDVAVALSARRSQGGRALAERIWVLAAVALFSGWHWQQLERPDAVAR